jgi:hypothetical protein
MYGHRKIMNEDWKIVDRYKNNTRDNMPMDETIISFSDRIIDVFEMVNQENGGSKTVENNLVVYHIPIEKPASVICLLTFEEEKETLKKETENIILSDLINGDKNAKARAAYMAISLDMAKDLKKKYPKQWKEACYGLSGYWKVIANVVSGDTFNSLKALRAKFAAEGFIPLKEQPKSEDLFKDMETWKDPKTLYTAKKK